MSNNDVMSIICESRPHALALVKSGVVKAADVRWLFSDHAFKDDVARTARRLP